MSEKITKQKIIKIQNLYYTHKIGFFEKNNLNKVKKRKSERKVPSKGKKSKNLIQKVVKK